jgi:formamidopyrimidine-DNA glycosylase
MAEGPQVKLKTEWLGRHLAGRTIVECRAARPSVRDFPAALTGRRVERVRCRGKHIFIETEGELTIHNHLLMRGRWSKVGGHLLFLDTAVWLALYVGPYTVVNTGGQMLRLEGPEELAPSRARLGPDAMAEPYPREPVARALRGSPLPVAEALLDQALVCGLGNIARSEVLFAAGVDPCRPAADLDPGEADRLHRAIPQVLWASYRQGGRWTCDVYRRDRRPCRACGTPIVRAYLKPSGRSIYFCPRCQGSR